MRLPGHPSQGFALIAAGALGVVGIALVTQHVFDMQPCPWCVLQRLVFVTIALVALAGLAWRSRTGARIVAALVGLLASSGAAAALWQHFVAASSTSCNLTLADRIVAATTLDGLLPQVFAPMASCADAAATLIGVPYEFYSLASFVLILAVALWSATRKAPSRGMAAR